MAIDRTRYRQLDFIGARILQARELNWLQEIDQGVAVGDNETSVSGQLQAQFRQGALYNVTVSVSGLVVTLSATDNTKPMLIFARDRWEIFPSNNDTVTDMFGTYTGNHTITIDGTGIYPGTVTSFVYLNWQLKIRTGGLAGDDVALTDSLTNEAVASAGELILNVSDVDTSAAGLSGSQLAKNTSPILLLSFVNNGSVLVPIATDNVLNQALANKTVSGFVNTTTNTPTVVSTDDPRMSSTRPASDDSVHDASVRVPVAPGGTNSDGTPVYNLSSDIGGINAAKIIYVAGTQLVSDFIGWVKAQLTSLLTRYNSHEGGFIGLINTHPMPTASQVGAAPLSHVGLPLNLPTSHPAVVNQDSGGYKLNRSDGFGAMNDPAYGVYVGGSSIASLNHDGDVSSSLAAASSALPGGGRTTSGALGRMSILAQVVAQHVNQLSHSNPHGLTAGDLGAATIDYVDTGDANTLSSANNYTNAQIAGLLAGFTSYLGSNGYIKLPNSFGGFIIQWGVANVFNPTAISFPMAFPNACLRVVTSAYNTTYNSTSGISYSTTGFVGNDQHGGYDSWIALGY